MASADLDIDGVLAAARQLGNDDLDVALAAARQAAAVIHRYFHAPPVAVEEKPGMHGDLVSIVDKEVDALILGHLRAQRPDDLILSEELSPELPAASDDEQRRRLWIVDPLDGTVGFLFRASERYPSTLIALRVGGRTEVAVVWFGVVNQIFYAVRGRGAYHNGLPLRVGSDAAATPVAEAWIDMNQYSDVDYESAEFDAVRKRLRRRGCGARLVTTLPAHSGIACYIAEGRQRVHAVVHDNNPLSVKQGPWDVAAPQLVLEEAGGVYLDGRTGQQYDALQRASIIVAAASRPLAERIVALMVDTD